MASKIVTDLGVTSARIEFRRDAGSGITARVFVLTTRGEEVADYTTAELGAIIANAADRTAIRNAIATIYGDALTRLGFA